MKKMSRYKRETAQWGMLLAATAALLVAAGCGQQEKEKEPEVSVQTTPA
jgi:hypothetical protein